MSASTNTSATTASRTGSPFARVKSQFGDKAQLVAAVQALATAELWIDRTNADKGISRVSNGKLLRLHALLARVKGEFGTRQRLVDAILTLEGHSKDEDLRVRLNTQSLPRLVDQHDALVRRAKRASSKAAAPAARVPRSKRAQAKAKARA
jgi:hypothetical protein